MPQIIERGRNDTRHILEAEGAEIVLSVKMWAQLCGIGYSTAKKILAAGNGPRRTRLSEHRYGITTSAHKAWLRERTEP